MEIIIKGNICKQVFIFWIMGKMITGEQPTGFSGGFHIQMGMSFCFSPFILLTRHARKDAP